MLPACVPVVAEVWWPPVTFERSESTLGLIDVLDLFQKVLWSLEQNLLYLVGQDR